MSGLPTGVKGRVLAVLIALIALGVVYLGAAAPLLNLYAEREARLRQEGMLLPRLQAAAAELPALRARRAELQTAEGSRELVLDGASDALASANLQSRIEAFAAAAGVSIGSTEAVPAEPRDGYRRIGLRLVLNGPYDALIRLLAKLEAANLPLILDNLQIHGVLRRPGRAPASQPDAGLDAGLDVYAFRANEKPAAGKP
jgi:Tfp pilus assembly protein PilO